MKNIQEREDQPWHQNYMVWMIILLPATVVVASLFTVYIAVQNAPVLNDQPLSKPASISRSEP